MIDALRGAGLRMGTVYAPVETEDEHGESITTRRYRSWTTDSVKARAAEALGATVVEYRSADPTCSGWEITATVVERG